MQWSNPTQQKKVIDAARKLVALASELHLTVEEFEKAKECTSRYAAIEPGEPTEYIAPED